MLVLINQETKDIMSRLIRSDFDKINFSQEYIYNKAASLIKVAKECGLIDLAVDMETDKRAEIC